MTNPWNTNAGDAGDHGGNMRQLETNELIDVGGGEIHIPTGPGLVIWPYPGQQRHLLSDYDFGISELFGP